MTTDEVPFVHVPAQAGATVTVTLPSPAVVFATPVTVQVAVVEPAATLIVLPHVVVARAGVAFVTVNGTTKPPAGAAALSVTVTVCEDPLSLTFAVVGVMFTVGKSSLLMVTAALVVAPSV